MNINEFQNQLNNDVVLSENVKKQKKEEIRQNEIKKLGDELKIDTKNGYDTFKLLREQNWINLKGLFVNKYNIEKPTNNNRLDLNNDKKRYDEFNKLPTALQKELLDRVDTNKEFDLLLPELERTVKRDKYLMMKDYGSLNDTFGDETGSIIGYFGASMATAMIDPKLAAIDVGVGLATGGIGALGAEGISGFITAYKLLSRGKKYYKNLSRFKQTLFDSALVGINAGSQEKLLQNSTLKGENNGDIIMSAVGGAVLGGGISGLAKFINYKKFKVEDLKSTDLNRELKELNNVKEEDISNIKPKNKQEDNNIDNLNIDKSTHQENINEVFNEYKNDNSDFGNKVKTEMNKFLSNVEVNGFIPKQLYFAINRFHRWFKLNNEASFTAQAESLKEFFDTYQLGELFETYPETRTRFFLETVFIDSSNGVKKYLRNIIREQHNFELSIEDALLRFSSIKSEIKLTEKDDFFLTRLSYPHIRPSDEAAILQIKTDGILDSNLVVQFDDYDGNPFTIRNPISPKEISKLHKLYLEANLLVNFSNENHFIVAISKRGFIIGGLFYLHLDKETVYMDKIVVANRYRRMGVGEKLMNEFFERLRTRNFKQVVTGFFRPEYFYQFDFKIDRKHSGLVKKL